MKLLLILSLFTCTIAFAQPAITPTSASPVAAQLDTSKLALTKMQKDEINGYYSQMQQVEELRVRAIKRILDANHFNPDSVIFYGFRRDSMLFSVIPKPSKPATAKSKSKSKPK